MKGSASLERRKESKTKKTTENPRHNLGLMGEFSIILVWMGSHVYILLMGTKAGVGSTLE